MSVQVTNKIKLFSSHCVYSFLPLAIVVGIFLGIQMTLPAFALGVSGNQSAMPSSLSTGLVGYWSFDKSAMTNATATDASGLNNNGTLTNMVGSTTATSGKIEQALVFNGINQYISVPSVPSLAIVGDITISAWIYMDGASCTGFWNILGKVGGGTGGVSIPAPYDFYIDNANSCRPILYRGNGGNAGPGASYQGVLGTVAPSFRKWQHVVVTMSGTTVTHYLNGATNGSGTLTVSGGIIDRGVALRIATDDLLAGDFFKGKIDEVRVYNRALSGKEVSQLYVSGQTIVANSPNKVVDQGGLIGYWPFDGKTMIGATTTDISGNNNNGTLINTTRPAVVKLGKIGQAINFNGATTSSYVRVPFGPTLDSPAISISFWFKANATPTANDTIVSRDFDGNGIAYSFDLRGGPWNPTFCTYYTVGNLVICVSATGPPNFGNFEVGKWYHVVGTFDGSKSYRIYVNGAYNQINEEPTPLFVASSNPGLTIGAFLNQGNPERYFNGSVDDLRIYNRALTDTEVQQLYKSGTAIGSYSAPSSSGVGSASGLIGHYTFDGKHIFGTTTTDISGNANTGNMVNMTAQSAATIGKIGQGLKFDGVNDVITTTNSYVNPTQYTIATWFKTSYAPGGKIIGFGNTQTGTQANRDRHLYISSDSRLFFGQFNGTTCIISSTSTLADGKWHHAVGVANATTMFLYLDGKLLGTLPCTPEAYTGWWRIGGGDIAGWPTPPATSTFNGSLDDVRIYNRPLSQTEVTQLYKTGAK